MHRLESDFSSSPAQSCAPWGPAVGVGGAFFATLTLGFTEGCLEIERRPIPLRFALRFAVANVLPSAVWNSVPARHVAAASGVPLSALIHDAELVGSRSIAVGKRLVLVKSVRALRRAAGSYGLAWSLWRWYEAEAAASNTNNDKLGTVKCEESVVRLAPVNSQLSQASRRKHGEHIVTVPIVSQRWKKQGVNRAVDAVDWKKLGIRVQLEDGAGGQDERVKVIEVELTDSETAAAYCGKKLKTTASRGDDTLVRSVAVLPLSGPPLPSSIADLFDVCFNPLSAVLTFIASVCHKRDVTHVFLLVDEEDEVDNIETEADDVNAKDPRLHLSSSQLVAGLLYRHGITSTVLTAQDKELAGEEGSRANNVVDIDRVVFVISESLRTGHASARKMSEQGLITEHNTCFVVEESLRGQNVPFREVQAESKLLEMAASPEMEEQNARAAEGRADAAEHRPVATYLSIADVTDQTLQAIRELVRQGRKPDTIQAAVYQTYGAQRVVAPKRLDQYSDIHI